MVDVLQHHSGAVEPYLADAGHSYGNWRPLQSAVEIPAIECDIVGPGVVQNVEARLGGVHEHVVEQGHKPVGTDDLVEWVRESQVRAGQRSPGLQIIETPICR